MIELIGRVRQRVTVLLVEHDMDAVFRLAERISVPYFGAGEWRDHRHRNPA